MIAALWEGIRHFRPWEFDSPDQPGSWKFMSYEFITRLDALRGIVNRPFAVNSGYRTNAYNEKLPTYRTNAYNEKLPTASPDSAHLKGLAADIACPDSSFRWKVIYNAKILGFQRIGIGNGFIHLDLDDTKAQGVIWIYV